MRDYEPRIKELEALEDGWYDGKALAPTQLSIEQYRKFLDGLTACPTMNGGVQVEARLEGWEVSVEFHSDGTVLAFTFRDGH